MVWSHLCKTVHRGIIPLCERGEAEAVWNTVVANDEKEGINPNANKHEWHASIFTPKYSNKVKCTMLPSAWETKAVRESGIRLEPCTRTRDKISISRCRSVRPSRSAVASALLCEGVVWSSRTACAARGSCCWKGSREEEREKKNYIWVDIRFWFYQWCDWKIMCMRIDRTQSHMRMDRMMSHKNSAGSIRLKLRNMSLLLQSRKYYIWCMSRKIVIKKMRMSRKVD